MEAVLEGRPDCYEVLEGHDLQAGTLENTVLEMSLGKLVNSQPNSFDIHRLLRISNYLRTVLGLVPAEVLEALRVLQVPAKVWTIPF